jgi:hypothetical protein
MSPDDWNNPGQSVLGMQVKTTGDEVLVWFNRHAEPVLAILPSAGWDVGLLSDDKTVAPFTGNTIFLPPRSVVALVKAQVPPDKTPNEVPPEKGPEPAKEPEGVPPSGPPEQAPPPVEAPPPNAPTEVPPPKTA